MLAYQLGIAKKMSVMLLHVIFFTMVLTIPTIPAHAYVEALGNVIDVYTSEDSLTLVIDNGSEPQDDLLEIQVLSENILRVDYRPNGISQSPGTPMIDPNKTWEGVGASIDISGDPIIITTSEMRVEISKYPVRMTYRKADGTPLLWEPQSGGIFHDGVRLQHATGDNIYGIRSFGAFEEAEGILRNNSNHPAHAGEQGDAGGPFMWSTSGYGILVDSDGGYPYTEDLTGKLEFYYGETPVEGRRYVKNNVEYYVMIGEPEDIMEAYFEVTGRAPMLPKWSLGFMNFEWDMDQNELMEHVDNYRAKNIPIDGYALDYDWKRYGENNYGEFRWNTANFPDAATTSLKSTMDSKGIKMIGITKPRIVTRDLNNQRTIQYHDAEAGGYWYPGHSEYTDYFIPVTVRSIDPYSKATRSWFWESSIDAFDKGIIGWWNDETDKVSSGSAQFWFGNFTTTHLSQGFYEGQRSYTNDKKRVWQTARTYYPGAHRYATTLWSGDIGIQYHKGEKIDWAAGMQEQTDVMLSSINLGQMKWGMDAGGFNKQDGTIDNPTPELYTRWMQFSALTPVFRVHGNHQQQRQPWFYGKTAEEVSKAAIHLRYSFIPYMYAYERLAYEKGLGLVRPLIFDYPEDEHVKNYTDAWMFGDYLLAAPVIHQEQTSKNIYLPQGTWIDYFRGNTYTGGQTIHYPLNSVSWTDIPLFIKKGAIIPTQRVLDYVGQSPITMVNIDVFPDDQETSFTYYDDDGDSYGYEAGQYFKQPITGQDLGAADTSVKIKAKEGSYVPDVQYYLVKVQGRGATDVTINDGPITAYQNLESLKQANGEGWATGREIYGDVTYIKVEAAKAYDKNISITGNTTALTDSLQYEAEEASLSGRTTNERAAVASNHPGYSGTGFVNGLHHKGAAVTFYANVKTAGDYPIEIGYANGTTSDQTLGIYVNGQRVKQAVFSNLSSWSDWVTKEVILPLNAGQNIITLQNDEAAGDTGNVNIDYINLPFNPLQAKYEAEAARLSGGAGMNQNHGFYSGTGFVDGITSVGARVEFEVWVPESGSHQVALKYANGTGSTKTLSTYLNGVKQNQISLPSPGSNWSTWNQLIQTVPLNAGKNTIRYQYDSGDSGNVNLDRILVSHTEIMPSESEKNLLDNPGFEREASLPSNWTEWHPSGQSLAYGIDSGSGVNPPEAPINGNQRAYFYAAGPYQQSIHQVINVPENNAYYSLEAWVRLKNTTPQVARAEIMDYGGAPIYYDIHKGGIWKLITIKDIYVTSGKIDVGFYVDSPGGTTLHIDEVRIIRQE